jgi:hypothetical protein
MPWGVRMQTIVKEAKYETMGSGVDCGEHRVCRKEAAVGKTHLYDRHLNNGYS